MTIEIDPYKSPRALSAQDAPSGLPLWIRILGNIYFWPKLYQYAVGFSNEFEWLQSGAESAGQFLRYALNVPAYFACFFFLFGLKTLTRKFWQVYAIVAISDEARSFIFSGHEGIYDVFIFIVLAPLYIMTLSYAFLSAGIWSSSNGSAHI